jgi:hypothetical protein
MRRFSIDTDTTEARRAAVAAELDARRGYAASLRRKARRLAARGVPADAAREALIGQAVASARRRFPAAADVWERAAWIGWHARQVGRLAALVGSEPE